MIAIAWLVAHTIVSSSRTVSSKLRILFQYECRCVYNG